MELKYGLISVDDHVQETPDTWTNYMSTQKWENLIPHLEEQADGSQVWMVEGRTVERRFGGRDRRNHGGPKPDPASVGPSPPSRLCSLTKTQSHGR